MIEEKIFVLINKVFVFLEKVYYVLNKILDYIEKYFYIFLRFILLILFYVRNRKTINIVFRYIKSKIKNYVSRFIR